MSQKWVTLLKRDNGTWDAVFDNVVVGNYDDEIEAGILVEAVNTALNEMTRDVVKKMLKEQLAEIIDKFLKEDEHESAQ